MARSRFGTDGFTILEALVALAVVSAVLVVGVETVGLGAGARERAAGHVTLRRLAEGQLAEMALRTGPELKSMLGKTEGRFAPPDGDARWFLAVSEEEPGSGLFRLDLRVESEGLALEVSTYADRFGELWRRRR